MNPAKYLGRQFDWHTYNCADFVIEVWLSETGVDLRDPNEGHPTSYEEMCRVALEQERRLVGPVVRELLWPDEKPCLVLLEHERRPPHLGVLLGKKRLLHLPKRGVSCLDDVDEAMRRGGFCRARYFR